MFISFSITFISFGNKIYRQVRGIPMSTICALLIADLFLYCYNFSLWSNFTRLLLDQILFNNTYCYLYDIFTFNNSDFYKYNTEIYPTELSLKKPITIVSNAHFWTSSYGVYISQLVLMYISQGKISTKIYDKKKVF